VIGKNSAELHVYGLRIFQAFNINRIEHVTSW
jgi:hypothetical protein